MKRTYFFLILIIAIFYVALFCSCQSDSIAKDPLTIKADSVLTLMTLEEKIGQMTLFTSDWDQTGPTLRENYQQNIRTGTCGAIFNAHTAAYTRKLQKIAVEETRLGIPLIFGYDVIHGYKTIFPIPLGEASSWDMEAIEKAARIAAIESTAAGLHWTFAPMVDIARDPRWGRIMEGSGEDPYLGQKVAAAKVRGFQGNDIGKNNTMLACAKHYAAYGAAQAGRDYHTVDISERVLREIYLPPFKAAKDEGVRTFMTAFNELNGIPASGNRFLLTEILREEWGFDGFVVTDYTSINEMVLHGVAATDKAAGELAVNAGVDMDMQGAVFYDYLKKSVEEGKVQEAQIDQAVRNILRMKFELGLFDDPYLYSDTEREKQEVLAADHLEFAREFARKSIVLLKNDNLREGQTGNILPISKNVKTVAVIGPLADNKSDLMGGWHAAGNADDCVTLLEGIKAKVGNTSNILFSKGCEIEGDDKSDFALALSIVSRADVIIVAVGEREWMTGEAASRSHLGLPGVQTDLVKELVKTGKPVVVVLMNGRPLVLPWVFNNAPAILETWYTGTQGGNAIADVLFGDYNPSGKLTVSFPRNEGQIPIFYSVKNTGRPMTGNDKFTSRYLDVPNSPQYPFGFGLSYTTFNYSSVEVDKISFGANDKLSINVTVYNSGNYDGEEVVQLYVRDLVGSVTRPLKELKGFEKIFLKKGESKKVEFILTADSLAFYTADMIFKHEPGEFEIFIGGNSDTTNSTKVTLR